MKYASPHALEGLSCAPRQPALRERGFEFVTETRDGVSFVFWQEGTVACLLASRLPASDLRALAREKAMAAA